jgi:hypothetical protein
MDLGDIVIYGGQRFYVRGVDPVGVHPRYLYLEDIQTGRTASVAFEQHPDAKGRSRGRIRLVSESANESATRSDPARGARELEHGDKNR